MHSEHVQGWGAGSGGMPDVKSGTPSRAEVYGHLRWFPVQESGWAWLGPLWPNRGAGFRPQHVTFQSLPNPSPRAYKRGSMEQLESRLSASLRLALLLNTIGVRLPEHASSSRGGSGATSILCDSLPCCRRPGIILLIIIR